MKFCQVLRRMGGQSLPFLWGAQQFFECPRQRVRVAIRKSHPTGTDCLRKAPAAGADRDAPASNSLQSGHAEWFVVARRDNKNLVRPEKTDQRNAALRPCERHLLV